MGYNRNIDLLEGRKAKVLCTNGKVYEGFGNIPCQGNDKNNEDVDGILFTTNEGKDIILIESDIKEIEFLDD